MQNTPEIHLSNKQPVHVMNNSQIQSLGREKPGFSPVNPIEKEELLTELSGEINRFETFFTRIKNERTPIAGYLAVIITLFLNLFYLDSYPRNYMVIWILGSLYFYLFYPFLIPVLMVINFLTGSREKKTPVISKADIIFQIKSLELKKNYFFVIRLAIRFFLLGLMPLTWGMVAIYSVSFIFAIVLRLIGQIPQMTFLLIFVQCLGIIIFYLNLWLLKRHYALISRLFLGAISRLNRVRLLLVLILGVLTVFIATCATIILIIAMLLPGYTTSMYIAGSELINNRANIWILYLLISMFVWMQFLQSILSRKIPIRFGTELLDRLKNVRNFLNQDSSVPTVNDPNFATGTSSMAWKDIRSLLAEARIHTASCTKIAGLFPVYIIGLDIGEIIRSWKEMDHTCMFCWK